MHDFRIYCDVARYRSFSRAAEEHGITQSAASQRVSHLEKRLGITLIDRSTRPLQLTEAGQALLEQAQRLIEQYDGLFRQMARFKPATVDTVRVDAIYSAGINLLNHLKESFEAAHEGVKVVLEYKPPDKVYEAVRERRCDLGILSYPGRWRQVEVVPLRDEPMAVVSSPSHPAASVDAISAADLGRWPMVTFEPQLPVGRQIRRYLREHGVTPKITNVFDNIDTMKAAVAATGQVAILPKRTVLREVAAGTLAVTSLSPELARPMGVIYRKRAGATAWPQAVRSFIDFLLEHAGPDADMVDEAEALGRQMVGGKV